MSWHLTWRYGHVTLVTRYCFDTFQLIIIWMSIIRLKKWLQAVTLARRLNFSHFR